MKKMNIIRGNRAITEQTGPHTKAEHFDWKQGRYEFVRKNYKKNKRRHFFKKT